MPKVTSEKEHVGGKYTTMCGHNKCGIFVQWGRLCSSFGVGDGSHGVEHGILDLCQGQPPGPSSDGGAGEGSLPDKEAIWVKEGQLVV